METIDNRSKIYELEEIYKYKDLIEITDRDIIKEIIFDRDEQSTVFYNEFMKLVAMEVDHELNKNQFTELKEELIFEMKKYLERKK